MNLSRKEYLFLVFILCVSFLLNITNNLYQLSGDERASLSTAAGAGITMNRFEGSSSFRYTQAAPLEKKFFTQHDYRQRNTAKNVIRSAINFDSGNMIAYHLLLHGWFNFIGISIFKARLLSAIFALLTVLFTFLLVKQLTGNLYVAFITSIILSIHPLLLHYAHMARGYAASLCFSMASAYLLVTIVSNDFSFRKKLFVYLGLALLAALAILSHYLSAAVFLFMAFWLIIRKNFFREHLVPASLAFLVTLFIIFLWMKNGGFEGLQEMKKIDEWYLKNTSAQVHTSARSLTEGTVQQLLAIFGNYGQYLGFRLRSFAFLLIFPLTAIALGLNQLKNTDEKKSIPFLTGAVIFIIGFSALLAIKSGHTTSFNARYGIYAIPFACALLAFALQSVLSGSLSKIKKIITGFSLAATFIIFIFSTIPAYTGIASTYHSDPQLHKDVLNFNLQKHYSNGGYEPIAKKIETMYSPGDTVIYNDWNTAQVVNLFLQDNDENIVQKVVPGAEKNIFIYESASGTFKEISEAEK